MVLKEPKTLKIEINYREVSFPEGVTVLRAAELNGIYIPSLCSHKDLSPFGACRLCVVEIEGMRGFPLSCDTKAREGMKVLTDTAKLRELRSEILKLILSEHPSSCLICGEKDECVDYQGTIRKVGVTTGCRYCPNDGQCELQELVEKIGVTEIDYPICYHGYEAEQDDPFFDRDYNVCILCGRCVRMCQEVRGTGVLAFTHRGPNAKIGPAFEMSHIEAGCEFCGACVDICPTGALADKVSKWDGKPDGFDVSTCPFCGIGCSVELYHKNGELSKVKAHLDPEINDGQLCVRGRFCMPEMTHHYSRARKPQLMKGKYFREIEWEEALKAVSDKLKGISPADFQMLVSPDLTNEGLFAAKKFALECIGSGNIDSSARKSLKGGLGLWSKLFSNDISIKAIEKSDAILVVGLDSRFHFSIVGIKVHKAVRNGAKLGVIDPFDSNIARYTDDWLRPTVGTEGILVEAIAEAIAGDEGRLEAAAQKAAVDISVLKEIVEHLKGAEDISIIVGPQPFRYNDRASLVNGLNIFAGLGNVNCVPLYYGANTRGALEIGVFPELISGVEKSADCTISALRDGSKKPKVLYLVGDMPFSERPECDFLIVQDTYLPPFEVDAFFPASNFAESCGTLVNVEGRVQEIVRIEKLPDGAITGFTRPDWKIFQMLAAEMGKDLPQWNIAGDVLADISKAIPGFSSTADRKPRVMNAIEEIPLETSKNPAQGADGFVLVTGPPAFLHRGADIASKVDGLKVLALEEGFRMNPLDLELLGIEPGDKVYLSPGEGADGIEGVAKSDDECPRGVVYYSCSGTHNKAAPSISGNPVPVEVKAAVVVAK